MSTIWKTTLDGVEYSGVWSKWGVVRLLPGKVPADGYGVERGIIDRYPYASLGYYINSKRAAGQPWEWCTDEEFFSQKPGTVADDVADEITRLKKELTDARMLINDVQSLIMSYKVKPWTGSGTMAKVPQ